MKLQRQIDLLLAQRASQWHEDLNEAGETERAEFVRWLKQSPQHVDEYLRTVYLDRALERLDRHRSENVEALLGKVVPPPSALLCADTDDIAPRSNGRRRSIWAVAAGIAICTLGLATLYPALRAVRGIELSTEVGEQRMVELADASIVTLNADTELQVQLEESIRDVALVRGEALFNVARDPLRPFRVLTRNGIVQAIGTEFNVYERLDGSIRVSVLEGSVKIIPRGARAQNAASADVAIVRNGEEVHILPDGKIRRSDRADVLRSVAWRQRQLVFDEAPLEEVVYEFNRATRATRVRIEGVAPASRHYNGIFNGADPQSLADLLARERDLVVERRAGEIVIRPRSHREASASK